MLYAPPGLLVNVYLHNLLSINYTFPVLLSLLLFWFSI